MRIILLSSIASLACASPAMAQTALAPVAVTDGTVLEVVAEGRTTRVPDIATINAGVVTQAATATAAMADNSRRMAGVLAALKKAGIAPRDIATSAIALNAQFRYVENQPPVLTGYQATNTVTVRFRDIAASGRILDALVAQGANQIDGPALSLDNADAAMDEARTDAVKRARARAELYARAAGLSVARILSISEAGSTAPPPGPVVYAMAKREADTAVMPGEASVTATVSVRFLLK